MVINGYNGYVEVCLYGVMVRVVEFYLFSRNGGCFCFLIGIWDVEVFLRRWELGVVYGFFLVCEEYMLVFGFGSVNSIICFWELEEVLIVLDGRFVYMDMFLSFLIL